MKKRVSLLALCISLLMLCTSLTGCGFVQDFMDGFEQGFEQAMKEQEFASLKIEDTFEDGKPYRLYFLSNGDGTCALRYVTVNPDHQGEFEIIIPETSPAGDTVTEIDMGFLNREVHVAEAPSEYFPFVMTEATMKAVNDTALANGISDFDYNKMNAYYLKLPLEHVTSEDDMAEYLHYYPIISHCSIYVFNASASQTEMNRIYQYLKTYGEWDAEKYQQNASEILAYAKQSDSLEAAELCMTILYQSDVSQLKAISIPKTVTTINNLTWKGMSGLESVTVADDNPTIKMIDGCLVDIATGTLKLYMRDDGMIPDSVNVQILDSYAFQCSNLSVTETSANAGIHLYIPEGVTEIREYCFYEMEVENNSGFDVYLPASLRVFGQSYIHPTFHYPGTLQEWEMRVTCTGFKEGSSILLKTTEIDWPMEIFFSE